MSLLTNFQTIVNVIKQSISRKTDKDYVDNGFKKVDNDIKGINNILGNKVNRSELTPSIFNVSLMYESTNIKVTLLNNTVKDIQDSLNSNKNVYLFVYAVQINTELTAMLNKTFRLNTYSNSGYKYNGYNFVLFDTLNNSKIIYTVRINGTDDENLNYGYLYSGVYTNVYSELIGTPNLATVATTGLYSDLTGLPSLATVATSGSYNDLTNKPTIPVVPTNISAFNNDSGYTTQSEVGTAISTAITGAEEVSIGNTQPTGNQKIWYKTNQSNSVVEYNVKISGAWETIDSNKVVVYDSSKNSEIAYYANIQYIIDGGKHPVLLYQDKVYNFYYWDNVNRVFYFSRVAKTTQYYDNTPFLEIVKIYNSNPYVEITSSTLEETANKVTVITEVSTNAQYPSAKCVYDYIDTVIGNADTLLGTGVIS